MEQTACLNIIGQSIIAELIEEYNGLTELRARIFLCDWAPGVAQDDAQAESAQSAYLHAIHIVARQMGINLKLNREVVKCAK